MTVAPLLGPEQESAQFLGSQIPRPFVLLLAQVADVGRDILLDESAALRQGEDLLDGAYLCGATINWG